jgi:hypothetical protein
MATTAIVTRQSLRPILESSWLSSPHLDRRQESQQYAVASLSWLMNRQRIEIGHPTRCSRVFRKSITMRSSRTSTAPGRTGVGQSPK